MDEGERNVKKKVVSINHLVWFGKYSAQFHFDFPPHLFQASVSIQHQYRLYFKTIFPLFNNISSWYIDYVISTMNWILGSVFLHSLVYNFSQHYKELAPKRNASIIDSITALRASLRCNSTPRIVQLTAYSAYSAPTFDSHFFICLQTAVTLQQLKSILKSKHNVEFSVVLCNPMSAQVSINA